MHQRSNCLQRGNLAFCELRNCYVNVSIDYFFSRNMNIWMPGCSFWYEPELCILFSIWGSMIEQAKYHCFLGDLRSDFPDYDAVSQVAQVNLRHTATESGIFSISLPDMYSCFCFDAGTHALVSLLEFFGKSMWLCIHTSTIWLLVSARDRGWEAKVEGQQCGPRFF